jgi:hypothetical protein
LIVAELFGGFSWLVNVLHSVLIGLQEIGSTLLEEDICIADAGAFIIV